MPATTSARMSPGPYALDYNDKRNWIELIASDGFVVQTFDLEEHGATEEANAHAAKNIPLMVRSFREIRDLVNSLKGLSGRELVMRAEINRIVAHVMDEVENWKRPEQPAQVISLEERREEMAA